MHASRILLITIVVSCLSFSQAISQVSVTDSSLRIPMFYAAFAVQAPDGDLADRFGVNSNIGGGFLYKSQSNFTFGADFNFLFGKTIRNEELLLSNLKTENGNIISMSGNYAAYSLYQRGFYFGGKAGRLFPINKSQPNSGLLLLGSLGYLQHKIRIEVANNDVPQLTGDYKRGYDRLTGGFYIGQFVGYQYLSNSRLLNFFGGIELIQAFTKPFRDINFDTMEADPKQNRLDLLFGIKIGWIIPVYTRMPEKYYFY
ncbi:MAG: hypothetical protein K8R53_01885 [Bacteroidales bacterium]|nr:hypothetical protein [Bacteroidales bacterium]